MSEHGALTGTYRCDCGGCWPEFLRGAIDLPGCPACNADWGRWPASARSDGSGDTDADATPARPERDADDAPADVLLAGAPE